MKNHYWSHGATCHELYTRGPCVQGHIFIYNHTSMNTQCVCSPELITNFDYETKQCYELETTGPCKPGQVFTFDAASLSARCRCLPGYVKWLPSDHCFREYTKGPCETGYFLQPIETYRTLEQDHFLLPGYILTPGTWDNTGECVKSTCKGGQLYDPATQKCYSVGHRGPCSHGKLWVYERATSMRGICHCDPQLVGYWAPDKACYQIGEKGPCPEKTILSYDVKSSKLSCRCDHRRGYVNWRNQCIKMIIEHKPRRILELLQFRDELQDREKNRVRVAAQSQDSLIHNATMSSLLSELDSTQPSQSQSKYNTALSTLFDQTPSTSSLVTDSYSVVTINNKMVSRPIQRIKLRKKANIRNRQRIKNNRQKNLNNSEVKNIATKLNKDNEKKESNRSVKQSTGDEISSMELMSNNPQLYEQLLIKDFFHSMFR